MAIFGFKKRKDEKLEQEAQAAKVVTDKKGSTKSSKVAAKNAEKQKVSQVSSPVLSSDTESISASVIIRPRITEKSGVLSQNGSYTFEINKTANKNTVSKAITALYKVIPERVSIINTPIKNVFVKGRRGTIAGMKKAIVTLRKGDKIDFV